LFTFQEFLTYLSSKHISFLYPSKTEGESVVKKLLRLSNIYYMLKSITDGLSES